MYRVTGFLFAALLMLCSPVCAAVFFVDASATGPENGTSWQSAFRSIQPAVDAAHDAGGGEVWVAGGVYSQRLGQMLDDRYTAIHPDAVDILGSEHTLYFTPPGGPLNAIHVSAYYLDGDIHSVPPDLAYNTTTQSQPLLPRFKDLAASNPDVMLFYNHPEAPRLPMQDIIAVANEGIFEAVEVQGSSGYNIVIWDAILANLDDQATGCRKIVWGVTSDDKHNAANFGYNYYGYMLGVIPTTAQSPVYADRRLAYRDMIRRGSIVSIPPAAPCGVPTYTLASYGDHTAALFRVVVDIPAVDGTTWSEVNFYGCDPGGGDTTGGKLLLSVPVAAGGVRDVRYYLTPTGSAGTPLTAAQRANIKYIRPVLRRVVNGVVKDAYFQPVRLTHEGKWWNGPDVTLAGGHAIVGASPYPAGGADSGERVYFNTHCHTNGSGDADVSSTAMRRRYAAELSKIEPGKPVFTIVTDHDLFTPFPTPGRSGFDLKEGVHVYGGFAGTETQRDQRNPEANQTVIDAQRLGRCVYVDGSNWQDNSNGTIDGLVLTNGQADFGSGGGVLNWHSSITISNCQFTFCTAGSGGALANTGGSPKVVNCDFAKNSAPYAGGVIVSELNSALEIVHCVINGGSSARGGGLFSRDSHTALRGTEISDCSATMNGGGGLYFAAGSLTVDRCQFLRNAGTTSFSYGGGMRLATTSPVTITNSVFAGNVVAPGSFGAAILTTNPATITNNTFVANGGAGGSTGGVYIWNSSPQISNNIFAHNLHWGITRYCTNNCQPVLRNNLLFNNLGSNYSGITPGEGDMVADPLFAYWQDGDYHLMPGSPAIDAGWAAAPQQPFEDMDGQPRPAGAGMDIGADEYWLTASTLYGAKQGPEDAIWASLSGAVVTAAFADAFYLEPESRETGIRVQMAGHGLAVGDKASVDGVVRLNIDSELYIDAYRAGRLGSGSVEPLHMSIKTLGGGPFGQQPGVTGDVGLNNIGLLVQVTGSYTYLDPQRFLLDDGSAKPVLCLVPDTVTLDPSWQFVTVTGISSCMAEDAQVVSVVRVREQASIAPVVW